MRHSRPRRTKPWFGHRKPGQSVEALESLQEYHPFWLKLLMKLSLHGEIWFFPYPKDRHSTRFSFQAYGYFKSDTPAKPHPHAHRFIDQQWPIAGPKRPKRVPLSGACIWAEDLAGARLRGWKDWRGDTTIAIYHYTNGSVALTDIAAAIAIANGQIEFGQSDFECSPRSDEFKTWKAFYQAAIPYQHDFKVPRGKPDTTLRFLDTGNWMIFLGANGGSYQAVITTI